MPTVPKTRRGVGGALFSTAGVHPHNAKRFDDDTLALLSRLSETPEVVAIGECGLDYDRDFSPRDVQRRVFAAQLELAVAYLALDMHIGITGWICDERRGKHLVPLVRRIPKERLFVETDAPFLLPRDLDPRPRHRRNEPSHLPHVLAAVARAAGREPSEVRKQTLENARMLFGID